MAACPLWGQAVPSKKIITPNDYAMWHTLRFPQISNNGNWVSYQIDYKQRQDTLVVLHISNHTKYELANAHSGQFSRSKNPEVFTFKNPEKGVGILHLTSGKIEWVEKANRFSFSKDGVYLACYTLGTNGFVNIVHLPTGTSKTIDGVEEFAFNPTGSKAAWIENTNDNSQIKIICLQSQQTGTVISSKKAKYKVLKWNDQGTGFAFLETKPNNKVSRLYYFNQKATPYLKELDSQRVALPYGIEMNTNPISFSKDGTQIFFYVNPITKTENKKDSTEIKVQVWKGTDKWIYPRQQKDWEYQKTDWLSVWWPESGKVNQIGNSTRPDALVTGQEKFALTYNLLTYEPQYWQSPKTDYYCVNLETGEQNLCFEKLETTSEFLNLAPQGFYVAYFKKGDWWVYNMIEQSHTNVSKQINQSLKFKEPPFSFTDIPYGCAGWSQEHELLVYDEFDIWKVNIFSKKAERLTHGREKKVRYRFYNKLITNSKTPRNPGVDGDLYNLSEINFLSVLDRQYNEGYSILQNDGTVVPFIMGKNKSSELHRAKHSNKYVYSEQTSTKPPSLHFINEDNEVIPIARSNPQQTSFIQGKTELIYYKNKQGDTLKGLLHYPDTYQKDKKYPLIVHIYEIQSNKYHKYSNPSYYNGDGFNYRNYTADGYFVLEPDVLIKKGTPGLSAIDCVLTATHQVIDKGFIDKKGIGLIGHSFGGYETAFVITQTNLFATAVVGAGVFDVISFYHSVGKNFGKQQLWRFENQQWRMGTSFYQNREGYYKNSPLFYAQNIQTPTLIWTGKKDYHLNWHQSEEMYLSLRRLNVPVQLLIYEEEGHAVMQNKTQKDLTIRIKNWFETYLKT